MDYPTKQHTWANNRIYLEHVLNLYEEKTVAIKLGLNNDRIHTVINFVGQDIENLQGLEYHDEEGILSFLSRGDKRFIKGIYGWMCWEIKNRPDIDMTCLTMDDYDSYCLNKATQLSDLSTFQPTIPMAPSMPYALVSSTPIQAPMFKTPFP